MSVTGRLCGPTVWARKKLASTSLIHTILYINFMTTGGAVMVGSQKKFQKNPL